MLSIKYAAKLAIGAVERFAMPAVTEVHRRTDEDGADCWLVFINHREEAWIIRETEEAITVDAIDTAIDPEQENWEQLH